MSGTTSQRLKPVSFGHDPSLAPQQSHLLRTVCGALSTTAYVAHIASESEQDAPWHDYAVHHELAHYQQLVSTPFGLHIALLDWVCAFSIVRALQLTVEHRPQIKIPLMMECIGPFREELLATQVAFAISVKQLYEPWLLDSAKLDRRNCSQTEGLLTEILQETFLFPSRFSGSSVKVSGEIPQRQALSGQDHPKAKCRWRITTRDVMENYATAAVAMHPFVRSESSAFYGRPAELLRETQHTVPRRYTYLLRELTRFYDRKCLFHGFLAGAVQLFDLALSGALIPGMPDYGAVGGKWENLHPAWRFYKEIEYLAGDPDLCHKVFSGDPNSCADAMEQLCDRIGWPSWSSTMNGIDLTPFRDLPFVSWIIEEFDVALAARRANRNLLLPPFLSGYMSMTSAFGSFDPKSAMSLKDHVSHAIEKGMSPSRLTPPVWLFNTKRSKSESASTKTAGYAAIWYYVSHFVNRMLFHNDLKYPAVLMPENEVRQFLCDMTGYSLKNIVSAR
jgi:hypothetical protein